MHGLMILIVEIPREWMAGMPKCVSVKFSNPKLCDGLIHDTVTTADTATFSNFCGQVPQV